MVDLRRFRTSAAMMAVLLATLGNGLSPTLVRAQAPEEASRTLGLRVFGGRSENFETLGLEGAVSLASRVEAIVFVEAWGPTATLFGGPIEREHPREPPEYGWSMGGGARLAFLEHPRSFMTASGGFHRYTWGEEVEGAPFIGLAVGQAWLVWSHLELGWELRGRRVSAYTKDRYFVYEEEWRETVHEPEYLFALTLSVGGVL